MLFFNKIKAYMTKTKPSLASAVLFATILAVVAFTVPAVSFATGIGSKTFDTHTLGTATKKKMVVPAQPKNDSVAGIITAINGKDITVRLSNPNLGDQATIIVHAGSAKIAKGSVVPPKNKKPKTVSDFEKIAKASRTPIKRTGPKPNMKFLFLVRRIRTEH